jgi:iron complex outermembrane receptor protein
MPKTHGRKGMNLMQKKLPIVGIWPAIVVFSSLFPLSPTVAQKTDPNQADSVHQFEIPAGPLSPALVEFGKQADVPIVFKPESTKGKKTNGVHGSYRISEALQLMLKGSDLELVRSEGGVVSVRPFRQVNDALRENPATQSQADHGEFTTQDIPIPVIIVIAPGYAPLATDGATRTATPLADIPQSVQIVSNEVMKSQQAQTISDVLQNVASVSIDENGAAQIRGFPAALSVNGLTDNAALSSPLGGLTTPIIDVQQVEVFKGPDSILAGSMSPGGIINVVKKVPQPTPREELSVQISSYDHLLAAADITGRLLPGNDHFSFRVIGQAEHAKDTFGGYQNYRNNLLSAALGFKNTATDFVLTGEYVDQRLPATPFTVLDFNGRLLPINPSIPITNKEDGYAFKTKTVSYDFVQKLPEDLSFHSKFTYGTGTLSLRQYFLELVEDYTTGLALYAPSADDTFVRGFESDNNLSGTIKIGPISQTLLAGYSYQHANATLTDRQSGTFVETSIFNPQLPPARLDPTQPLNSLTMPAQIESQIYLQDQIAWGPAHLQINVARVHGEQGGSPPFSQSKWLPNFGAVYEVVKDVSLYASYQRSFRLQNAQFTLVDGSLPPPAEGYQKEVGIKLTSGRKLNGIVSAFDSYESASAIYTPSLGGYTLGGGGRSRGVEGDFEGEIRSGCKIITSLTHTSFAPSAGAYSQVPKNQYSLWGTYELQGGPAKGLGFGGGVFGRVGYQISDDAGVTHRIPAKTKVDLTSFYKWKQLTASFGLKNVLDQRLYADYAYADSVGVLPGRTFIFTLGTVF